MAQSNRRLIEGLKRARAALRTFGEACGDWVAPVVYNKPELKQFGEVHPDDMTVEELREVAAYLSASGQIHDAIDYRCEARRRQRQKES